MDPVEGASSLPGVGDQPYIHMRHRGCLSAGTEEKREGGGRSPTAQVVPVGT